MLMFILSHPLQQLPCPLLVVRLQKSCARKCIAWARLCHLFYFQRGFIADKNVNASFACLFFSFSRISFVHGMDARVPEKRKRQSAAQCYLAECMNQKSEQKQNVKMELKNRLLLQRSLNHTLAKLWKIEYCGGKEWSWKWQKTAHSVSLCVCSKLWHRFEFRFNGKLKHDCVRSHCSALDERTEEKSAIAWKWINGHEQALNHPNKIQQRKAHTEMHEIAALVLERKTASMTVNL